MLTMHMRALRGAALGFFATFGLTLAGSTGAADKPAMKDAPGKLSYVRVYTGTDGITHFADEQLTLTSSGASGAEAQLTVSPIGDVKGATFASLKAGVTEDWHVAPRRQFMVVIRGTVELSVADGQKRRFVPGQFVLLEDTTGKGHVTHIPGPEDHVALAVPVPDGVPTKR